MCIKFIHEWNSVGVKNNLIENRGNKFLLCLLETEVQEHFFGCPKNNKNEIWKDIASKMNMIKTALAIIRKLKHCVSGKSVEKTTKVDEFEERFCRALNEQQQIGLTQVRYARIRHEWGNVQHTYRKHIGIGTWSSQESFTSYAMEELLEEWIHYIPLRDDYSDLNGVGVGAWWGGEAD